MLIGCGVGGEDAGQETVEFEVLGRGGGRGWGSEASRRTETAEGEGLGARGGRRRRRAVARGDYKLVGVG